MATTPGGLPYPIGTDHVVDGDDAIGALAVAVDTRPLALAPLVVVGGNLFAGAYYAIGVAGGFVPELRGGITFASATAIFTVPRAGLYRVLFGVAFAAMTAGTAGSVRGVRIDDGAGAPATRAATFSPATATANPQVVSGSRLLRLAANANLRLAAYHDGSAAAPLQLTDTYVSIEWAGI